MVCSLAEMEDELTKRICKSEVNAVGVRGRTPPIKWKDKVLEYIRERKDRQK